MLPVTEYLVQNWGSIASLAGLVVSVVGLAWAIWVARQARTAARAAQDASIDTRAAIGRTLGIVDLQRAIALIQRLKEVHRNGRWEIALEHYQTLRTMLGEIKANLSNRSSDSIEGIQGDVKRLTEIENKVSRAVRAGSQLNERDQVGANEFLNSLQVKLEGLANSIMFHGDAGSGE